MKMYHKNSPLPVDAHASQIENMKRRGWTDSPPKGKTKSKDEPAKAAPKEV